MARTQKKTGRPSSYAPEYCQALVDHMKGGLSFESFGGVVGKSKQTLYDWEKIHPEFLDAKKLGETLSQLWWERLGKAAMVGQAQTLPDGTRIDFKNFDTTIWIFSMKNRFGWRDKQEHTGKDGGPIESKNEITLTIRDYSTEPGKPKN